MPAPTYIISKIADPIFAVVIGISAATTRIHREEKEKGRSTSETLAAGKRRLAGLALSNGHSVSQEQSPETHRKAMELQKERRKVAGLPLPYDQTKR